MKLIIDCDPGNGVPGANVDDAVALVFALRHPELDLRAIWTVFGNTSAAEGFEAARRIVAQLRAELPVRCGSDRPLSGDRDAWRRRLDSPSQDPAVYSLWGAGPAPVRYGASDADDPLPALERDLRAAGDGVVLACLGPLTNVARLVRAAPDALAGVERICLMGGTLGHGDLVDTNFAVDPLAAALVLHSGIPLTIVPLDVTRTTELSRKWWRELVDAPGGPRDPLRDVAEWLEPWLEYSSRTRPVGGMWLHDLVAVATLAEPTIVASRRVRVDVADSPAGKLVRRADGVEVELVTEVDNEALLALLAVALRPKAPRPSPGRPG